MSDWPGLYEPDGIEQVYDPVVKSAEAALFAAKSLSGGVLVARKEGVGSKRASGNSKEKLLDVGTSKAALEAQQRPPRLILAWEAENMVQDHWRGWMARGLQMVQVNSPGRAVCRAGTQISILTVDHRREVNTTLPSVFAWACWLTVKQQLCRPSHPVFLTILESAFAMEAAYQAGKTTEPKVLDLTGPGQLADALFEHLLLRYGIVPEQITGLGEQDAIRAGDVLIYNRRAFQVSIARDPRHCQNSTLCQSLRYPRRMSGRVAR